MKLVNFSISDLLLDELDEHIKSHGYAHRSDFLRQAVKEKMMRDVRARGVRMDE